MKHEKKVFVARDMVMHICISNVLARNARLYGCHGLYGPIWVRYCRFGGWGAGDRIVAAPWPFNFQRTMTDMA